MPKIQDDYRYAKGWATSHVVLALIVDAILFLLIGIAVG